MAQWIEIGRALSFSVLYVGRLSGFCCAACFLTNKRKYVNYAQSEVRQNKVSDVSRLKILMTDSPLWWTYLAVVFVHQLPDLSYVSFWIKFFAKNFLYKSDLKFKASFDLICTLIWPQTASKCDTHHHKSWYLK